MSLFIDRRSLAHPEWLDQFWMDFDRQTALIKKGIIYLAPLPVLDTIQ